MLFQKFLDKFASILIGVSSLVFAIVFFMIDRDLSAGARLIVASRWLFLSMGISAILLLPNYRRVKKTQWATIVVTLVFAGITVLLDDERIIMWRSTITNTILGLLFFGLYFLRKAPLEILLGRPLELNLPREIWIRLNIVWGLYMFMCGLINTILVLFFSEAIWMTVKTFVIPAIGFVFMATMFGYLFQQDKRQKMAVLEAEESKGNIDKSIIE